jgi:hypothetical protein
MRGGTLSCGPYLMYSLLIHFAQVDQQQSATTNKLSNEQWQALVALHRTLLHEHHDFFLAFQHPSSSLALRRLAAKYAMPARMWRHGINSFLELLRHRLPDSLDHMLAFVHLAYSMMVLLMESMPSFEETWTECLGDLARCRTAIEEADLRDREVWSGVARMWYNKAADKSPNVAKIQHHLAILVRPNIVQQLCYYAKALVSVTPFPTTRKSMMLLFNPFCGGSELAQRIGDKNILQYMHVVLAYLLGLSFVPNPILCVKGCIPWEGIAIFLNTLGRSDVVNARVEDTDFPQQLSDTGRQLPEDFIMRRLFWAQHYFPTEFFIGQITNEDKRCLWDGVLLASVSDTNGH